LLVVKPKQRFGNPKSLDALDEPTPIRPAAKLAVRNDCETSVLLQVDGVEDGGILSGGKMLIVQLARGKGAKSVA
jgi:hypothetical protein